MNWLLLILVFIIIFLLGALYYALRFPNGKLFPTNRAKLLRKIGPLATGVLEDLNIRFYTFSSDRKLITLSATYKYNVKGKFFFVTLPTTSEKLSGALILSAKTIRQLITEDHEREFPERLELQDGTILNGRDEIKTYYFDRLRNDHPEVKVIFDRKNPALSTVRDWNNGANP